MQRFRTYIVGRERSCDVRLDDPSVSRVHAEVVRLPSGRLYVTDRATTNRTFVLDGADWHSIRQAFLEPGGRVRFGNVEMSAGRLNALCPQAGPPGPVGGGKGGSAPTEEDSPDPRKGLVRDPRTGEILEQKAAGGR